MAPPNSAETEALQRAMPISRLLDCGMDYADAISLFQRTSAGEAWADVGEALGREQLARAAQARGRFGVTARTAQEAAIACFVFAQMAFNYDEPRKRSLYREIRVAGETLASDMDGRLARVSVPYSGSLLIGWLLKPESAAPTAGVVLFGGQSGWGLAYLPMAKALAERGVATLLAEGPGQGETRLEHGIYVDVDVPGAYMAFADYLRNDCGLCSVGIWGNSFGGLWAAKTAARDPRIGACCVNGSLAKPSVLPFRMAREQSRAMLGTDDDDAVQANFDRMRWRSGDDQIGCPLLILHGGSDPLIQPADQQPFMDAATTSDATWRTWPDGEHTIYNRAAERTAFVSDWFASRLMRP